MGAYRPVQYHGLESWSIITTINIRILACRWNLPSALDRPICHADLMHIWCVQAEDVLCDLGTDCTDCGPWVYKLDNTEVQPPKPISALREEGIIVRVAATKTVPSFKMPYSDHLKDKDVSGQMFAGQVYERGLSMVHHRVQTFYVVDMVP